MRIIGDIGALAGSLVAADGMNTDMVVKDDRQDDNQYRPHSSLGYLTPNEFTLNWNHNQGIAKELAH